MNSNLLVDDPVFLAKYFQLLYQYSDPEAVQQFIDKHREKIESLQAVLQTEFDDYKLDYKFLRQNAKRIRARLFPLQNSGLKAYRSTSEGATSQVQLQNFHVLPIQMLGSGIEKTSHSEPLAKELLVPAFNQYMIPSLQEISIPKDHQVLFYKLPGIDSTFHCKIFDWPQPKAVLPVLQLLERQEPSENECYNIRDKRLEFKTETCVLRETLYLPADWILIINPGTKVDLQSGTAIIAAGSRPRHPCVPQ